MKKYDYVVIGAGIAGSSLSYFLNKYSKSVLLIDKNSDLALGASGAAGAFLSPLLGKENPFKSLVAKALAFSIKLYKEEFSELLNNCGTCRIAKNEEDEKKFKTYLSSMDFDFQVSEEGYFFPIGSTIKPYELCLALAKDVQKLFDYEVKKIEKIEKLWYINDEIEAKKLFLATGANTSLIKEKYFNLRAVWGQKIDILSSTKLDINYHKEVSLSKSLRKEGKYLISIGATHNRFEEDMSDTSYNLKLKNINFLKHNEKTLKLMQEDTKKLLNKAQDIKKLKDIEVLDIKIGARASSIDYFPMLGALIDSKKSFETYPHIKNGSHIKNEKLFLIDNLYTLNGLGGRGFVLALYLAKQLVEYVVNNKRLDDSITNHRLFLRWARRNKENL